MILNRGIHEVIGALLSIIFVFFLTKANFLFGIVFVIAFIWLVFTRENFRKHNRDDSWLIDERWNESWTEDDLWGNERTIQELPPVKIFVL